MLLNVVNPLSLVNLMDNHEWSDKFKMLTVIKYVITFKFFVCEILKNLGIFAHYRQMFDENFPVTRIEKYLQLSE